MSLQQISNAPLAGNRLKGIGYKHYVLLILLLSAAIRFTSLTDRYLWCDEASSVLTSRYDVAALLYHASFDVHPPLYYLLLHGWMVLFGDSILAVRSLSLVFGVATVALAIRLTRWLANERAALLAGALMAIMPMAVRYSQEARMYALMGMLTLAATMALVLWLKTPANRRYLAIYALLMALSFYTHYFTIFASITHWGVLLALACRRDEPCRYLKQPAWWLANLAIGVAYIPWLLVLLDLLAHITELKAGGDVGWIPQVTWSDLPAMYWRLFSGNDGRGYPGIIFWLLPPCFLGLSCLWLRRRGGDRKYPLLLFCSVFVPVTLLFIVSLRTPLFVDRYLFFAALGIPVILAMIITESESRSRKISLLLLVGLLFGSGLRNDYPPEKDEFKAMVHYINGNYQANDAVVVSNMFNYLSYVYYNKKGYRALLYTPANPNGISGKPNAYGFGTFFHDRAAQTYVDNLHALAGNHRRIWLVSGGDFNQDFGRLPPGWVNTGTFKSGGFETRLFVAQPVR
ncbi:Predicted membrane protein [Serratia entomophila]|uniref:glycosyltransferase family 39 protein n=1 Tax=Serratia entomophila TaxID=42906 RepID=UPI002179E205|nr:glycosyltransferase family 39 protein [Serratia entomophila]CAI0896584.1 Predicted membrane protein [Serratia entomophila]CAI1681807.1 Predicted membrane protein [Serratia entomophila]CAI1727240.1 Predicted membrane protein [Serratia entomophila]CAI1764243.1 Predicted membrane protein [Serratia entomophila]CAI2054296.1 Predicted membrane protein [Serratia entomophila]